MRPKEDADWLRSAAKFVPPGAEVLMMNPGLDAGHEYNMSKRLHDIAGRLETATYAEPRLENAAYCYDCGRQYGNEHGFPDLIITKDAWQRISPTKDDGGLLCPSCICKRLCEAGMRDVEGAFMSGPIKSVDSSLMHTLRWMENLRVQGHGWSCPECGGGREREQNPPEAPR